MTTIDHSKPVPESSQVNGSQELNVTIIRTPHDDTRPYFSMSRNTAQDRSLTWEARGVLAYLLSKPSDWQIIIADLKQNCGRDKVRNILDELKMHGYLVITQGHDEKGHFTAEYKLYETPITEKPSTVNQHTVKPETAKRPLHNTDKQSTDKKSSSRKVDPYFDAIKEVFGITAGGWVGSIKSMMLGNATKGEYARCNFDPPVTDAAEILAFKPYMLKRMADKKVTEITACVTIQRWFYDFRNERDNPRNVLSVLDGLRIVS